MADVSAGIKRYYKKYYRTGDRPYMSGYVNSNDMRTAMIIQIRQYIRVDDSFQLMRASGNKPWIFNLVPDFIEYCCGHDANKTIKWVIENFPNQPPQNLIQLIEAGRYDDIMRWKERWVSQFNQTAKDLGKKPASLLWKSIAENSSDDALKLAEWYHQYMPIFEHQHLHSFRNSEFWEFNASRHHNPLLACCIWTIRIASPKMCLWILENASDFKVDQYTIELQCRTSPPAVIHSLLMWLQNHGGEERPDYFMWTSAFEEACQNNFYPELAKCIVLWSEVEDSSYEFAHLAAYHNRVDILEWLYGRGELLNLSQHPLKLSAYYSVKTLQWLDKHGMDFNKGNHIVATKTIGRLIEQDSIHWLLDNPRFDPTIRIGNFNRVLETTKFLIQRCNVGIMDIVLNPPTIGDLVIQSSFDEFGGLPSSDGISFIRTLFRKLHNRGVDVLRYSPHIYSYRDESNPAAMQTAFLEVFPETIDQAPAGMAIAYRRHTPKLVKLVRIKRLLDRFYLKRHTDEAIISRADKIVMTI